MNFLIFPRETVQNKNFSKYLMYMICITIAIFIPLLNPKIVLPLPSSRTITFTESNSSDPDGLSIILMIGDGMGFEQVKLAQWVEKGVNGTLNMQELPIQGNIRTQNIENSITDSAASGTALATGFKARNGILSSTPANVEIPTILELSQDLNKSTGVITTTEITHATPAAFYSHVLSRGYESEIASQLVASDVDIIMGGGRNKFRSHQQTVQNLGYSIITNRTELLSETEGKVFGLFTEGAFPYERDRDRETTPSIAEMTQKSLELLSQDDDGFFLIVEGGQIDWAGHVNNDVDTALETIEFDKAVKTAIDFVYTHNNTILIVTADHETGGLTLKSETLTGPLPSENNTEDFNEGLRISRVRNVSLSWSSGGHTNENVPIYAFGDSLLAISNTTIENTEIFSLMKNFFLPLDRGKPAITIIQPENKTYNESRISVSIGTNESLPWVVYSLNNAPNITIPSLTTSFSLSNGSYFLKIFGNDTMGNIGCAEVSFTVSIPASMNTSISGSSSIESKTTPTLKILGIIPSFLLLVLAFRDRRKHR